MGFSRVNFWGSSIEDPVWGETRNSVLDDFGVDLSNGFLVGSGRNDPIQQVRLDEVADFRAECFLHSAGARRKGDNAVRGVTGLKSAGEELRRKKLKVPLNWEHRRFRVEMVRSRSCVTTGDVAKSAVLYHLQTTDRGS